MESIISEEDLLSGVEVLPTTEPNTPKNALKERNSLEQSGLSNFSKTSSPLKDSINKTPVKNPSAVHSFSERALEVQKALQSSLTDSLRKEVEIKSKWQASPGEVFLNSSTKTKLFPEKHSHFTMSAVPTKLDFVAMSKSENQALPQSNNEKSDQSVRPNELLIKSLGPNVCLSEQFPSSLSPIKSYTSGKDSDSTLLELSPKKKVLDDEQSTKKLLDFIQSLDKETANDITLAERMNQLSFMLKNSSINYGSKSDSEDTLFHKQGKVNELQMHKPASVETKENAVFKFAASKENSKNQSTFKAASGKAPTFKKSDSLPHFKKSKVKSNFSSSQVQPNQRSVHFAQMNKLEKRKAEGKSSVRNRKAKDLHPADKTDQEPVLEKIEFVKPSPSKPVIELNSVRNQLQSMLNLHKIDPLALDMTAYTDPHTSIQDSKEDMDTFRSTDTNTLLQVQPSDLVPASPTKQDAVDMTDSLTTEVFMLLKSNKQSNSNRSSIDSSVAAEIGILRDTLEKETYRRKHCEKQIQKLQKKVLDIQQELAVAHSTEKKKDMMIEQLDSTLAKVVGGWKAHEASLVKTVGELNSEKEKHREEVVKLKEMVVNLENELAKTLEELVEEKERVLRLEENDKSIRSSYQARAEEIAAVIDQKNEHSKKLLKKIDQFKNEKRDLQEKIDELAQDLKDKKSSFKQKEAQWEEAVADIEQRQKELLKKEKEVTQQERRRCETIQSALSSTEQEMTRLQSLLESQRGEVESMHTQAAVLEAKHRASLQKLEAEHRINVERQIMEKLSQVHEESQANESRIRENHKKQMLELLHSHKKELENQCHQYEEELRKRDESMRRTMADHEMAINQKLKLKSEDMRSQMMNKMQSLLQSHYNETLQIVGNTSGVTPQRAPIQSKETSLHFSTDPTSSFRTSLMMPRESEKHTITEQPSFVWKEPSIVKPIPTLPSTFSIGSAFSIAGPTLPPRSSSFQPLAAPSYRYQAPIRNASPEDRKQTTGSTDCIEDGVTNLSLISSISHGPVVTLPYSQSLPVTSNQNNVINPTNAIPAATAATTTTDDGNQSLSSGLSADEFRQVHLQHYVRMLLQHSPAEPRDTPDVPFQLSNKTKDEDKENVGRVQSVSSLSSQPSSTNTFVPLLNQNENVPVKQQAKFRVEQNETISRSLALEKKKVNAAGDAKKSRQNVRFAQDATKSNQSPEENSSNLQFLNPTQMGEISQILDLYSTVDTPTGETRLAAEHLLRYLRETNPSTTNESSILPSGTSSPLKRTAKQVINKFGDGQVGSVSGKSRSKSGTSPGKPTPVWR